MKRELDEGRPSGVKLNTESIQATWFEAITCVRGHVKNMRGGLSTQSAVTLAKLCYRTLLADGADALQAVRMQVVTPALERIVGAEPSPHSGCLGVGSNLVSLQEGR